MCWKSIIGFYDNFEIKQIHIFYPRLHALLLVDSSTYRRNEIIFFLGGGSINIKYGNTWNIRGYNPVTVATSRLSLFRGIHEFESQLGQADDKFRRLGKLPTSTWSGFQNLRKTITFVSAVNNDGLSIENTLCCVNRMQYPMDKP